MRRITDPLIDTTWVLYHRWIGYFFFYFYLYSWVRWM